MERGPFHGRGDLTLFRWWVILSNLPYIVNIIPLKSQVFLSAEIGKRALKLIWKYKGLRGAKMIWKRIRLAGSHFLFPNTFHCHWSQDWGDACPGKVPTGGVEYWVQKATLTYRQLDAANKHQSCVMGTKHLWETWKARERMRLDNTTPPYPRLYKYYLKGGKIHVIVKVLEERRWHLCIWTRQWYLS